MSAIGQLGGNGVGPVYHHPGLIKSRRCGRNWSHRQHQTATRLSIDPRTGVMIPGANAQVCPTNRPGGT
jgi:hypothetical protein